MCANLNYPLTRNEQLKLVTREKNTDFFRHVVESLFYDVRGFLFVKFRLFLNRTFRTKNCYFFCMLIQIVPRWQKKTVVACFCLISYICHQPWKRWIKHNPKLTCVFIEANEWIVNLQYSTTEVQNLILQILVLITPISTNSNLKRTKNNFKNYQFTV